LIVPQLPAAAEHPSQLRCAKWRQPRRIFVNSMSDLFHKEIPIAFIDSVFDTMEKADWHTYQVLTKRSSLIVRYLRNRYGGKKAPPHIWVGVSIENAQNAVRLKHLKAARAAVKFVSFEPLLLGLTRLLLLLEQRFRATMRFVWIHQSSLVKLPDARGPRRGRRPDRCAMVSD
jgi:protein gp37